MSTNLLPCDGCGQPASPEHIARRLQRLEWTTRYRPVHIGTLLLGAVSPQADADFLYAGTFEGEAVRLLHVAGIDAAGKTSEAVLAEFQRGGFLLTHVLECPIEYLPGNGIRDVGLLQRVAPVAARIRRSLKPKRVVLISEQLTPIASRFSSAELGCPVLLDDGKPFALDSSESRDAVSRLHETLANAAAR
jgi:hypothetical protein